MELKKRNALLPKIAKERKKIAQENELINQGLKAYDDNIYNTYRHIIRPQGISKVV
jgi:hypothetical protein